MNDTPDGLDGNVATTGFEVWHVAVPVNDLERSVKFYCDGLGFQLIGRDEYPSKRQAFIAIRPGGFTIELFEPKGMAEDAHMYKPDHFAFECHDIEYVRARIAANGIAVEDVDTLDNGVKYFSLMDPDDIPLEFFQGRALYEASIMKR